MKPMRVGIFGLGRGASYIRCFLLNNAEITAVCDKNQEKVKQCAEQLGNDVACYSDFDAFIEHDMDAVLLANYFHEHAGYAIRCLEKGIHVFSECLSNGTMAEGVALVRAAEKSNAIFMLAENYPYMMCNLEMRRVYRGGSLGKCLYAEGEYNHPFDPYSAEHIRCWYDGEKHWRNFLPRTYYVTHSLAPLMLITGAKPSRVTALPVVAPFPDDCLISSYVAERAAVITCLNDDGSVFRFTGCSAFGAEENYYRICGEKGQIESVKGDTGAVRLHYNSWEIPEGFHRRNDYFVSQNLQEQELLKGIGHGTSDYYVVREFLDCVRNHRTPEMDVHFSVRTASVAILAHRSMLENGVPYAIPDFTKEEERETYENDTLSPFWYSDGTPPTIPCTGVEGYEPSLIQKESFRKVLEDSES